MGVRTGELSAGVARLRERWQTVLGVLVALVGLRIAQAIFPALLAQLSRAEPMRWLAAISPHWTVAGIIVAVVLWIERRDLASIGLTHPSRRDLALSVAGFILGLAAFIVMEPVAQALGYHQTDRGTRTLINLFPVWMLVVITFTAAVTEEILYRGYPIERLEELTGSVWTGAIVTYVMFLAVHIPFYGVGATLQIAGWTLVVTALYLTTRNLVACMIMHGAQNMLSLVVLPLLSQGVL